MPVLDEHKVNHAKGDGEQITVDSASYGGAILEVGPSFTRNRCNTSLPPFTTVSNSALRFRPADFTCRAAKASQVRKRIKMKGTESISLTMLITWRTVRSPIPSRCRENQQA
ncbi:hypothetical protein EGR_10935 [Echinococcus granulosus]|uniref:Uncharacterized protein n=1 Tax=Echinococcus granulosus TaxID=6210 RepID=W6U761_ECHGR|nr:hypothetical protein EGR_10935 [Echinococcus granulosus]EUB54207.1 hypothetical protein EGR_10935 [Echinococcus granulosus]